MMSTISATPMPMPSPLRASSSAILEKSALSDAWPATWVAEVVRGRSLVVDEDDGDQRGLLALRHEPRCLIRVLLRDVVVGGRRRGDEVGAGEHTLQVRHEGLERRIVHRGALGQDDHVLRVLLLAAPELLVDHVLRLDRFGLVRERDVSRQDVAETGADERTRDDRERDPRDDDPPRSATAGPGEPLRIQLHCDPPAPRSRHR
jgi:hypothetical protein